MRRRVFFTLEFATTWWLQKGCKNMIFWINSPFDPLPLEGGRPMRYELLAKALVGLGHDVVWWSSDFHHLRKEKRSLEPAYHCDGFEVRLIPTPPYFSNVSWRRLLSHRRYAVSWRMMAVAALNREELQPPDAIILSMPPLGLFDQAKKFRDEYGCKIFVDIQDAWPENFYHFIPSCLRFLLGKLLFYSVDAAGRSYNGADCITTVAEKYLKIAQSYGSVCPRKVFPLGGLLPDLSAWEGESPHEPQKTDGEYDTKVNRLRLIYVGNLGSSYDLETMLKGVVDLVDDGVAVTLDVAGDGPCRRVVELVVSQSGGAVKFHGYLSGDELSLLINKCDVGVIPMKDELLVAIPNKLVDYASHGLAVINGLTSETKELLNEFDCGVLYETGSVDSFKQAVMKYHGDRDLLKLHQVNSRCMAEQNFDSAKISVEMARYLATACDHSVAARERVK